MNRFTRPCIAPKHHPPAAAAVAVERADAVEEAEMAAAMAAAMVVAMVVAAAEDAVAVGIECDCRGNVAPSHRMKRSFPHETPPSAPQPFLDVTSPRGDAGGESAHRGW